MGYDPKKLLEVALGEVGYLEKKDKNNLDDKTANAGDKNYTKYARDLDAMNFYNGRKQSVAWCDVFVDWCFVQAYGKAAALALTYQPTKAANNCGAGCKYSRGYYKSKGRLFDSPQPGDQVFFYPKDGIGGSVIQHTGLVYDVDGSYVYTVEGNTNGANGVIANGGGVCKKKYKLSYERFAGFGRPIWDTVTTVVEAEPQPVTPEPEKPKWGKTVTIASQNGGRVNIRKGNNTNYGRVALLTNGTKLEWIATAANGWHACVYGGQVAWVSGKYSSMA